MRVVRWGQSAYETDADLRLEAAATVALGGTYLVHLGTNPPLASADVLVVNSGTRVDAAAIATFGGKLVLTTTDVPTRPEYAVDLDWELGTKHDDSLFTFVPTKDSQQIALDELPVQRATEARSAKNKRSR